MLILNLAQLMHVNICLRKILMRIILNTFFLYIILINNAFAYIDPGSLSIILQSIIAAVASVYLFFGNLKEKFLSFFKKIKKKENDKKK